MATIEELRAQGRRSRAAIVHAAAVAFARLGYAASLSDIAAVLGKDKTALRYHFRTKRELALAVVDHQNTVWSAMQQAVSDDGIGGLDAVCALFGRAAVDSQREPYATAAVQLALNAAILDFELPDPLSRWLRATIDSLVEAQSLGELPAEANPAAVGIALANASLGAHQRHLHDLDQVDLSSELWHAWLLILRGTGVRNAERFEHWFRGVR